MIRLVDTPLDPGAALGAFCSSRRETGAVASFVGLARADGDETAALELDAYPGFTEAAIDALVAEARTRFSLQDAAVVHRFGRIEPGEAIVLVMTAATHRRAAFDACDYLMDQLKSRAPLWKKSHGAGGARWIEPTAADIRDLSRWERAKAP